LVNVPLGVLTIVLTVLGVPPSPRSPRRLDVAGLALAALALGAVTGGLIEAGQRGWTDPVAVVPVVLGLGAGVLFVVVERRQADPMLPMTMFSSRAFSGGAVAGGIFNFCLYGALLAVSLVLQGPLGQTAVRAGLAVLPLTLAVGIGSTVSARLTARVGSRLPMLLGYGAGALGAATLALAGGSGPLWLVVLGATVLGFCSVAMPAMTAVTMSGVDAAHTALGSGVLNTARQSGGALGAAVFGALLGVTGAPSLAAPMLVGVAAYLVAIGATVVTTAPGPGRGTIAVHRPT
jgi:DHA2 family methylenomycin A resistance protein-like MFS transporter